MRLLCLPYFQETGGTHRFSGRGEIFDHTGVEGCDCAASATGAERAISPPLNRNIDAVHPGSVNLISVQQIRTLRDF